MSEKLVESSANGSTRRKLPMPGERLKLGRSGLEVSPICVGMTEDPETVSAAFDAGVNFFFISADLHWPYYDGLRRGIAGLLQRKGVRRDDIVVAVVSYLQNPLFGSLQFNEVIESVQGLERVDVLVAGAAETQDFFGRYQSLMRARAGDAWGASAIGASFHDRIAACTAANLDLLDVSWVRYNALHTGARTDLFPHLRPRREGLIFNFKSTFAYVTPERFRELGLDDTTHWLPSRTDHYRFVLTRAALDGVLISPRNPTELRGMVDALEAGPLDHDEEDYVEKLSCLADRLRTRAQCRN